MLKANLPVKPFAPTTTAQTRWDHSALRRRMIIGAWAEDLEGELQRHLPPDRREAWGPSDLSSNPFEQITRQLSVLYSEIPSVTNSQGNIEGLIRESFVRIDVTPHTQGGKPPRAPGIRYRLVTPDFVYCESDADEPDKPIYYQELRM